MATWKSCSSCKTDIPFEETYWLCNVSTCNSKRMGMFFCSVGCWEAHLPTMRHREAWAVDKTAPSEAKWQEQQFQDTQNVEAKAASPVTTPAGVRKKIAVAPSSQKDDLPKDILIVVSKLKKYIKARSQMNTSENLMTALSDKVRALCDEAIQKAQEDGRRTVMDRDLR